MKPTTDAALAEAVRVTAHPLTSGARADDLLMDHVGDARLVLLGAATHGTHEFYAERAAITKRLVGEKGFAALGLEAAAPPAARVDRYVRHAGEDGDAAQALADFHGFPAWVWRNTDVVELVEWLRAHNDALPPYARKVGIHGLDLDTLKPVADIGPARVAENWNARERHMADALDALLAHLEGAARVVVWAHNLHVGDARATELGRRGELSLGQLVRERHGDHVVLVGFTTHHGTVAAAAEWAQPARPWRLRHARARSYEAVFHRAGVERFLLPCREIDRVPERLRRARLERAIGAIYRPDTERGSHYFAARLPGQFDVVLHADETRAVEPLEGDTAMIPRRLAG